MNKTKNKTLTRLIGTTSRSTQSEGKQKSTPAEQGYTGLLITVNDPVFFRDGKPFTMGEEVYTTGIFPPYPSVIQGALRSVYFKMHPAEIPQPGKETPDPTAEAEFRHVLLCHNRELLFPLPADLLPAQGKLISLRLTKRDENLFFSSLGNEYPFFLESGHEAKVESTAYHFLTRNGMNAYLQGQTIHSKDVIDLKKEGLISEEPRIGIGRTPYEVTAEGQLYRMTRLRLQKELQLHVASKNLKIPSHGLLSLGSEGVSAHYQFTQLPLKVPPCELSFSADTLYRLYVMTPFVERQGVPYLPSLLNLEGIQVQAYTMGRPSPVGGWDVKINGPKPLHHAIPAGAVFFLKIASRASFETLKAMHGSTQGDGFYRQQGFGGVLLGVHNNQTRHP